MYFPDHQAKQHSVHLANTLLGRNSAKNRKNHFIIFISYHRFFCIPKSISLSVLNSAAQPVFSAWPGGLMLYSLTLVSDSHGASWLNTAAKG